MSVERSSSTPKRLGICDVAALALGAAVIIGSMVAVSAFGVGDLPVYGLLFATLLSIIFALRRFHGPRAKVPVVSGSTTERVATLDGP